MRLTCWDCKKTISTEVPDETIIRATLVCPECFVIMCDKIERDVMKKVNCPEGITDCEHFKFEC